MVLLNTLEFYILVCQLLKAKFYIIFFNICFKFNLQYILFLFKLNIWNAPLRQFDSDVMPFGPLHNW